MRVSHWLVPALLAVPGELAGQAAPAAWTLAAGLDGIRFGAAARDTTAPAGSAVSLRPSGRVGAWVALQRAAGAWRVELALGWAGGNVEAGNEAVAIRDRTADLSRYRVSAGVERTVARVAAGELALTVSPLLDLWSLDGETRLRAGAECRLALRLPLGGAAIENRIGFGMSVRRWSQRMWTRGWRGNRSGR
jgi:hypothetical protein